MKNLSVRTQLLTLVILAVVGFLALGGMVLRSEYLALRAASVDKLTTLTERATLSGTSQTLILQGKQHRLEYTLRDWVL